MATTAGGIVTPSATDDPDVVGDLATMAASIEAGNAWVTTTTGFAAGTGWTLTGVAYKRVGGLVFIRVRCTKATSAVTVAAGNGDITNQTIATIPSSLWPTVTSPLYGTASGRIAGGYCDSSGNLFLSAVAGDGTNILVGDTIEMSGCYPLGV